MNDSILILVTLSAIINVIAVIVFFVMASNVANIRKTVAHDPLQQCIILFVLGQKDLLAGEIAKAIDSPGSRAKQLFDDVVIAHTEQEYQTALGKFNSYFKNYFALAGITPDFSKVSSYLINQKK